MNEIKKNIIDQYQKYANIYTHWMNGELNMEEEKLIPAKLQNPNNNYSIEDELVAYYFISRKLLLLNNISFQQILNHFSEIKGVDPDILPPLPQKYIKFVETAFATSVEFSVMILSWMDFIINDSESAYQFTRDLHKHWSEYIAGEYIYEDEVVREEGKGEKELSRDKIIKIKAYVYLKKLFQNIGCAFDNGQDNIKLKENIPIKIEELNAEINVWIERKNNNEYKLTIELDDISKAELSLLDYNVSFWKKDDLELEIKEPKYSKTRMVVILNDIPDKIGFELRSQ